MANPIPPLSLCKETYSQLARTHALIYTFRIEIFIHHCSYIYTHTQTSTLPPFLPPSLPTWLQTSSTSSHGLLAAWEIYGMWHEKWNEWVRSMYVCMYVCIYVYLLLLLLFLSLLENEMSYRVSDMFRVVVLVFMW